MAPRFRELGAAPPHLQYGKYHTVIITAAGEKPTRNDPDETFIWINYEDVTGAFGNTILGVNNSVDRFAHDARARLGRLCTSAHLLEDGRISHTIEPEELVGTLHRVTVTPDFRDMPEIGQVLPNTFGDKELREFLAAWQSKKKNIVIRHLESNGFDRSPIEA